ncbi:diguanylate cyclase [Faecalicatena sp. AGMB00832]|uniref:Diguanylate cyclase n=1 Tax=Faecalicatena faecalis TaxID=2726362 RepID=A0ABS6CZ28_9FIRM|nr:MULTISPECIES: diguanylate cyclase [Faecalicatena]MBU3874578.1 diguanylate cyclase [Faecalicatena faecalis]MCI6464775.1 diguanylate cyclase [Faecalicatena sp.]MDY5621077.1 diguanylate cyclase [Lachnospiraceae bacterium]
MNDLQVKLEEQDSYEALYEVMFLNGKLKGQFKGQLKGRLSIKKEIFQVVFVFFILISMLFAGILLWLVYNSSEDSVKNQLRDCNNQIVTYMEGMFYESSSIIEILSHDKAMINADENSYDQVVETMAKIEKEIPRVTYIYAGYTDGRICVAGYPLPEKSDATTRPWYQSARMSKGVSQTSYKDLYTGEWLLSQSKRLINSEGRLTGVIAIDCSNANINEQLSTKYRYTSQRSFLVNPQGIILAHPDENEINDSVQSRIDEKVWSEIVSGDRNYAIFENNGVTKIAYFEWIPETRLLAGTAIDRAEVFRPVYYSLISLLLLILVVSFVLSFVLSKVLSHRFAEPLIELAARVQHLAKGNVEAVDAASFTNKEIDEISDGIKAIVHEAIIREEKRKAAEYMSFHDSMTGLYNRRYFERELMKLDGKQYLPLCIVGCDLNGLKFVNDVFGHAAGDQLICTAAECLKEGCGGKGVLARTGGDEYTMIFPQTTRDEAEELIRRIQAVFDRPTVCGTKVSVSMGYALKEDCLQPIGETLKAADEMMYTQKLSRSSQIKHCLVSDIMKQAEENGMIRELTEEENQVLEVFAAKVCPESEQLLKKSYQLRKVGMCAFANLESAGYNGEEGLTRQHSEISYRILSTLDEYHEEADCILYYTEHWDGSGQPASLGGEEIPLAARILALTEAYFEGMSMDEIVEKAGTWFDPKLVKILFSMKGITKMGELL